MKSPWTDSYFRKKITSKTTKKYEFYGHGGLAFRCKLILMKCKRQLVVTSPIWRMYSWVSSSFWIKTAGKVEQTYLTENLIISQFFPENATDLFHQFATTTIWRMGDNSIHNPKLKRSLVIHLMQSIHIVSSWYMKNNG